jgi:putative transposase
LAIAVTRMRQKQRFTLTAWVFLPDHWHAIIYLPHPLSISQAMSAIKVSSMVAVNHGRREKGELWQERFFDHALRTVKKYGKPVEYIHRNPVKRGLAERLEDWKWSSFPEYAGVDAAEQQSRCGLAIDRVRLAADENAKT